jgi:dTDP-4-dehydrorhamnose reductase
MRLVGCDARGTVHFAASGACNRAEWARAILSAAGLNVQVEPCATAAFPRPAARPANSVFDLSRYIALTGDTPADWSAEVMDFVARSALAPIQ